MYNNCTMLVQAMVSNISDAVENSKNRLLLFFFLCNFRQSAVSQTRATAGCTYFYLYNYIEGDSSYFIKCLMLCINRANT